MYPWMTLSLPPIFPNFLGSILSFFLLTSKKHVSRPSSNLVLSFLCFVLLLFWINRHSNIIGLANVVLILITIYSILSLKKEYKVDVIRFITKWFAILLSISLLFYLLCLIGVPLPSIPLASALDYDATNYFFCLQSSISFRFQGYFIEPGHMTMGLAPLLFLNQYNYKNKYVLVLLIAQLFSVSLAGYICLVVGLLLTLLITKRRKGVLGLFLMIVFFVSIFVYVENRLLGDDYLKEVVVARLEWDGDSIAGDNRAAAGIDYYYNNVIHSSNKWTGIDVSENVLRGNAGYMVMVVSNGLIGLLLMIACYIIPAFSCKKQWWRLLALSLLLVMLLMQNSYPDWWCMIISLTCGAYFLQHLFYEESTFYCTQRGDARGGNGVNKYPQRTPSL